ncbi:MAG: (2Fe-2S)-binding protein [Sporomusaceae bacterium]|jgi:NADH dehydrogenase/NADH:ubiquinone oxidoreductase subunit G|nr:(2Fe-2S)-binding protein [Sporomusaceae bacterium]
MKITINGKTCAAESGQFILAAARQNGIEIPSLCHHDALLGQACCRLCLVEVESGDGKSEVVASCVYPVREALKVTTNSERIKRLRRGILTLLLERAPQAGGDLAAYCREYGVTKDVVFSETTDEKCILCGLCVKACEELGNSAIQTALRGVQKTVATPFNEPSPDCIGCAACARVCPSEAIKVSEKGGKRAIWGKTFELVKCAACGKPFATRQELEWLQKKILPVETSLAYCPQCRGRVMLNL